MNMKHTVLALLAVGWVATAASPQQGAKGGEWREFGGDKGSSKYSPLSQIDASNFSQLEVAWRWESADLLVDEKSPYPRQKFRSTPLMVKGVVYVPTELSQLAALDAGTGEQLWLYDPKSYDQGKPAQPNYYTRSVVYWTDGEAGEAGGIERIIMATIGRQLVSIDAVTGRPDPTFGEGGIVDLSRDLGREGIAIRNISHGVPAIVVRDTIVLGSRVFDLPPRDNSPPGHIRAYDVRTGKLKWRFHTIPQEGEDFVDAWENESWRTAGNTNAWAPLSADEELGYVYVGTSTPTNDFYGGHRHGDNVYAESLICIDVSTGKRVWHFQTVHHGIWDYDIASAPNLIDVVVDGRLVKAVAQVSKTAFTYVFDRVTGEPLWPIEERPVNNNSPVPGERLSPTQPFPTKPPAFDRQGLVVDDLIDFTGELRQEALEIAKGYVMGPMFPPVIVSGEGGKDAAIVLPSAGGGANHAGASIDPATGILYVPSSTRVSAMAVVKPDPARSDWRYVLDSFRGVEGPQGLPLVKPPYGRITAIDLGTGQHAWQIPFGDGPTRHPAIKHLDLGPLGNSRVANEGGLLVTRTLLIGYVHKQDDLGKELLGGTRLHAYDKTSGKLLAELEVAATLHSAPMTYLHQGRQYIVIAGGDAKGRQSPAQKAELLAFALPAAIAPVVSAAEPVVRVERLLDRPIITPDLHPSIGENIQGPSAIRVPDWVEDRLGDYYLYFADHKGLYIRLAYANELEGPWSIHPPGSLQIKGSHFLTEPPEVAPEVLAEIAARRRGNMSHSVLTEITTPHIASPDVHVDSAKRRIVMYFHGLNDVGTQRTRVATSSNGIDFKTQPQTLGRSYFRVFDYKGTTYSLVSGGVLWRSKDRFRDFESGPDLFTGNLRHAALLKRGDTLWVFYSQRGDAPERILLSRIELSADWLDWKASEAVEVLRPEHDWEGADAPSVPSVGSTAYGHVNQLRDPAILEDDGRIFLFYAVAGESGIALAEVFID